MPTGTTMLASAGLAPRDGRLDLSSEDGNVVHTDGIHWLHNEGGYRLSVEMEGAIEFADDFDDVVGLSDDGYFELEEKDGPRRQRLEIEVGRDGELERTYFVRGRKAEYDDEAQEWFTRVLGQAVRSLGIGAVVEKATFEDIVVLLGEEVHDA